MMEKPVKPVESLTTTPDAGSTNKEDASRLWELGKSLTNLISLLGDRDLPLSLRLSAPTIIPYLLELGVAVMELHQKSSDGTETSTTPTCGRTESGNPDVCPTCGHRPMTNAERAYRERKKDGT